MFLPPSFPWAWLVLGLAAWLPQPPNGDAAGQPDPHAPARERMVNEQIVSRGVRDPGVLRAVREVPRHLFVPAGEIDGAYDDTPLPIGHGQTISQPYIVALMTELARARPADRALEIGTGCGYQAAVLARLVNHVYTIEIVEALGEDAKARFARLGYANITARTGDGYQGWPAEAPFDIILVTAAPPQVPEALLQQLKPGGRLVIPVGDSLVQNLELIEKDAAGRLHRRTVAPVRFVPMIKREEEQR